MLNSLPFQHHHEDAVWIAQRLAELPALAYDVLTQQYERTYTDTTLKASEARRNANLALLEAVDTAKRVKPQSCRNISLSDEAIKLKAERLSLLARRSIRALGKDEASQPKAYQVACELLESQGLAVGAQDPAGLIARVQDEQFWRRRLTVTQDREEEHFMIASGAVGRGVGAYLSNPLHTRITNRIRNAYKALEHLEAVCEETGERLAMSKVIEGSMANPAVRRAELMVRMRGFENAAKALGHVGMFYTLTCPSKYHAKTISTGGKAIANPTYNGTNPRQAQAYLSTLWKRIRASFKYYELNVYGFRIAEPHHDGTPHWHLLLFMAKQDRYEVTRLMREYALSEDGNEKGAFKHRFTVVKIDTTKGSATGYIAKYVSKNIDGVGVDEDFESGKSASDSASRVRAWASLWGIRQFQQIGGAPVGVWRELRRIKAENDLEHDLLKQAYRAADGGDWERYLIAQGGVCVPRSLRPLKLYTLARIDSSTGEVLTNKYGEVVAKVKGISLWSNPTIETRVHTWRIETKADAVNTFNDVLKGAEITYKPDFDLMAQVQQTFRVSPASDLSSLVSAICANPWSTGNNCREPDLTPETTYREAEKWRRDAVAMWRKIQIKPYLDSWAHQHYESEADYVEACMQLFEPSTAQDYETRKEQAAIWLYNLDCEDEVSPIGQAISQGKGD
ncbi:MAG: replication endonuclease [Thiofilum sp.]|uniref:replication endonuclease n=1 Tax=Thiofilum sp. TaxID=2212733 RepID=UPI002600F07B|nr:replication endonuclease [Thiofilum sp.]MBK8454115.1 replication endonuclease [Thiofilum sp.]